MPPIKVFSDEPIHGNTDNQSTEPPQAEVPPPTRTVPASIPASTTAEASLEHPPPPQPGARPLPPSSSGSSAYLPPGVSAPAQPQPQSLPYGGSIATPTQSGTPNPSKPPMPHQAAIPPPIDSALATRSTVPNSSGLPPPAQQQPTTLNLGAAAPTHPPPTSTNSDASAGKPGGYVQNPYANSEVMPSPMATQDNNTFGLGGSGDSFGNEGGIWGVVKNMGEGLKKAEAEVWKYVDGKSG